MLFSQTSPHENYTQEQRFYSALIYYENVMPIRRVPEKEEFKFGQHNELLSGKIVYTKITYDKNSEWIKTDEEIILEFDIDSDPFEGPKANFSVRGDGYLEELLLRKSSEERFVFATTSELIFKIRELYSKLNSEQAKTYLLHGVERRLHSLINDVEFFNEHLPDNLKTTGRSTINNRDLCAQANRRLNGFLMDLTGCLDNIAWVISYEILDNIKANDAKSLNELENLKGRTIALFKKKFLEQIKMKDENFCTFLKEIGRWRIETITRFRDSTGHRIPFYIPSIVIGDNKDETQETINNISPNELPKWLEQNSQMHPYFIDSEYHRSSLIPLHRTLQEGIKTLTIILTRSFNFIDNAATAKILSPIENIKLTANN
ncbi:MAG TPA: hypothetical protein VD770_03100 [Coxiellaceae bacterium]|nr:hypothetical protein [Coxiellaceae bacterium]